MQWKPNFADANEEKQGVNPVNPYCGKQGAALFVSSDPKDTVSSPFGLNAPCHKVEDQQTVTQSLKIY